MDQYSIDYGTGKEIDQAYEPKLSASRKEHIRQMERFTQA